MTFANTLTRDEMKNLKAGRMEDTCYANCNGCSVHITQHSDSWDMVIHCNGDTEASTYDGQGQYNGTVCGGQC